MKPKMDERAGVIGLVICSGIVWLLGPCRKQDSPVVQIGEPEPTVTFVGER
jgi:hypothetical protein